MKRRGFLAGILAAGIAPAIVHNPMKIFVPKQDIAVPRTGRGITSSIIYLDESPVSVWESKTVAQIQADIVERIREMSSRLYTESGYIEAAEHIDRLVIQDPKMVQYLVGGHA